MVPLCSMSDHLSGDVTIFKIRFNLKLLIFCHQLIWEMLWETFLEQILKYFEDSKIFKFIVLVTAHLRMILFIYFVKTVKK